jgi:hypothetical protein
MVQPTYWSREKVIAGNIYHHNIHVFSSEIVKNCLLGYNALLSGENEPDISEEHMAPVFRNEK